MRLHRGSNRGQCESWRRAYSNGPAVRDAKTPLDSAVFFGRRALLPRDPAGLRRSRPRRERPTRRWSDRRISGSTCKCRRLLSERLPSLLPNNEAAFRGPLRRRLGTEFSGTPIPTGTANTTGISSRHLLRAGLPQAAVLPHIVGKSFQRFVAIGRPWIEPTIRPAVALVFVGRTSRHPAGNRLSR